MKLNWISCVFVLYSVAGGVAGRRNEPRTTIETNGLQFRDLPLKYEEVKQTSILPGCTWGDSGEYFDVEETWHPVLNEEHFCTLCQCLPVTNHGRVVGKVRCINLKDECVEPTHCESPILKEGACCKTCPEDDELEVDPTPTKLQFPHQPGDIGQPLVNSIFGDHDEPYVSLLTEKLLGSSSRSVARVSFRLHEPDLYFTLTYSRLKKPAAILFMDMANETIHRHDIEGRVADKVCGVWKNLPGEHLLKLRTGRMYVTVTSQRKPLGEVKGQIIQHRAYASESFSAILKSSRKRQSSLNSLLGDSGIVSMSVSPDGSNINVVALLDGLNEDNADRHRNINVTLELRRKSNIMFSTETTIYNGSRALEAVLEDVPKSARKWFSRGRVDFRVSVSGENSALSGEVEPLTTCTTLHAVLSGSEALGGPKILGTTGSALISIERKGAIGYKILHSTLPPGREIVAITLEAAPSPKGQRRKIIADLFDGYDGHGLAIGEYTRPKPREIQMLLRGEFYINIATNQYFNSELRGRITQLPYNPVINRETVLPIQLSGSSFEPSVATGAAGHAWMAFDGRCRLHYEISVRGINNEASHAYAQMGYYEDEVAQVNSVLAAFRGETTSGIIESEDIDSTFEENMQDGLTFVQISTKNHPTGEIRGQIIFPATCHETAVETTHIDEDACFFEDRYYPSGAQWLPKREPSCSVCRCVRHSTICDPIICPVLDCDDPITKPGGCCPTCPPPTEIDRTENEAVLPVSDGCNYNGDIFNNGDTWNPTLPIFGRQACTLCSCNGGIPTCERITCPALTCTNKTRREGACCQVCEDVEEVTDVESRSSTRERRRPKS